MPLSGVALPFGRVSLPCETSSAAYRQQTDQEPLPKHSFWKTAGTTMDPSACLADPRTIQHSQVPCEYLAGAIKQTVLTNTVLPVTLSDGAYGMPQRGVPTLNCQKSTHCNLFPAHTYDISEHHAMQVSSQALKTGRVSGCTQQHSTGHTGCSVPP